MLNEQQMQKFSIEFIEYALHWSLNQRQGQWCWWLQVVSMTDTSDGGTIHLYYGPQTDKA